VGTLVGGAFAGWLLAPRSVAGPVLLSLCLIAPSFAGGIPLLRTNAYPLGFKVALHRKDLGIALGMAREMGAELPVAEMAAEFETELISRDHADDDMSALARVIRERSGLPG